MFAKTASLALSRRAATLPHGAILPRTTTTTVHYFSSTTKDKESIWTSPTTWWSNRQEAKQEQKYVDKIKKMAETEKWTIGDMHAEIAESVTGWKANVPILNSSKEFVQGSLLYKQIGGVVSIVGADADEERLVNMTRTEKLKAAVAGEATLEDINMVALQFETMALMHRILRYRKVNNLEIPETSEAVQALMQLEAPKFLTKKQKTEMMQRNKKKMKGRR